MCGIGMIFSGKNGGWAVWGVMCLLSLAGFFLPYAYESMDSAGLLLYALHPWAWVLPLCLAGPFLASLKGVAPIAAFFPPGLCFLMCPKYPGAAGRALLFLLLSLAAAEAGRETAARKQKNTKGIRKGAERFGNGSPGKNTRKRT